jgi:hypothetical protein
MRYRRRRSRLRRRRDLHLRFEQGAQYRVLVSLKAPVLVGLRGRHDAEPGGALAQGEAQDQGALGRLEALRRVAAGKLATSGGDLGPRQQRAVDQQVRRDRRAPAPIDGDRLMASSPRAGTAGVRVRCRTTW